ncbi:hypothetical protein BDV95DRAFT_69160 [Massariosphaeria phaeospora]|uniref:Uncharacterized protein n=1 Tax=Massariosphaeria phaeospora TaxID=100035 RepID=A0A7C8I4R5_9PLEO|nr:hypothetical protein BDV95DRAFT_69160 [Massariosphaeria phaeospora]
MEMRKSPLRLMLCHYFCRTRTANSDVTNVPLPADSSLLRRAQRVPHGPSSWRLGPSPSTSHLRASSVTQELGTASERRSSGPATTISRVQTCEASLYQHSGPYTSLCGIGLFWCKEEQRPSTHRGTRTYGFSGPSIFWSTYVVPASWRSNMPRGSYRFQLRSATLIANPSRFLLCKAAAHVSETLHITPARMAPSTGQSWINDSSGAGCQRRDLSSTVSIQRCPCKPMRRIAAKTVRSGTR